MSIKEAIRLIRELAVIIVLIVVSYKFVSMEFTIDIGTLSATDIVALLMAFFAVSLSAAFYFKGSEASNLFYDNMHKFTQDTSVILGKIESKFGEQLRNIEQRSADLKESVDKYYLNNREQFSEEEKEEKRKQINKSKEQYDELLESVFSKVEVDANEKARLKEELQKREKELRSLETSLAEMERKKTEELKPRLSKYLEHKLLRVLDNEELLELKPKDLFLNILKHSMPRFRKDMEDAGFITSSEPRSTDEITKKGFDFFIETLDNAFSKYSQSET
jgi:Skp family chaperone for outer membrane proteins